MATSVSNTLTISLVFNVLLGLTFGGLYIFLYPGIDIRKDTPQTEQLHSKSNGSFKQNGFCFSCDDLGPEVGLKETVYTDVITVECGHRLCCTKDDVLRDFLLAVSDESKATDEMNKNRVSAVKKAFQFWRGREHAAHLYIDKHKHISTEGWVRWQAEDDFGTAFYSNISLVTDKDNLRISVPGKYYIYSALKIIQNSRPQSRNFNVNLKRFNKDNDIHTTNKRDADILLTKKFIIRKDEQSSWVSLHGLFELKKDDQIGIHIHKNVRELIERTPILNYFGMYKL